MRQRIALVALGLAVGLGAVAWSEPPPKPNLVPVFWELEFQFQTPKSIVLRPPGETRVQRFWYMLYSVTNLTRGDQMFVPEFTLYTDTGQILRAGERVPQAVFDAIKTRHNNPLLLDNATITGKILQGEDNAKDGVAIWRDIDPEARAFDVFVAGISGETKRVALTTSAPAEPASAATQPAGETVVLSKTLDLKYALPGEASARERAEPRLLSKEWVMR